MAKRFTDTNKYRKPFLRGLKGPYKLLWDFLYHECDHAGMWIVDFEIAQVYIGKDMPVNREEAIMYFNSDDLRIIEIDNGLRWFIPSFITFQYGTLSDKNRAHVNVISILKKYNLFNGASKELNSPFQGAMEKEKEKEIIIEKGVWGKNIPEAPLYPFDAFLHQHKIFSPVNLEFLNSEMWFEQKAMQLSLSNEKILELSREFVVDLRDRDLLEGKDLTGLRSHFISWAKKRRSGNSNLINGEKLSFIPNINER